LIGCGVSRRAMVDVRVDVLYTGWDRCDSEGVEGWGEEGE